MNPERRPTPTGIGRRLLALAAVAAIHACASPGGPPPLDAPLFEGEGPAHLVLEADLAAVRDERFQDGPPAARPGTLRFTTPGGARRGLAVMVRRRGNSRRHLCDFPPLLVTVPDSAGAGPVFAGLDALHHVSHCREGRPGFEALAVKEYLAYRIYRRLARESFPVRLARIRYRDRGRGENALEGSPERWGFLVEDRGRLAARVDGRWVDDPGAVERRGVDGERAALVAVFQYLIGNTDWGLSGLHNVMMLDAGGDRLLPVPFDFDFSGLVDAPYARPDPRWGAASVRERVFVGCATLEHLGPALDRVREQAVPILEEARTVPGLRPGEREAVVSYLRGFLERVRSGDAEEALRDTCRRRDDDLVDP